MATIHADWEGLKHFVEDYEAKYGYVNSNGMYVIRAIEGQIEVEARIVQTSPPNADQTDFETNFKPNADNMPLDGPHQVITFVKSSSITYVCESAHSDALTSEAKWRVTRYLKLGTDEYIQRAGGANYYSNIADNRESLFSTPALSETQSIQFDGINDEANGGNVFNFDAANAFSISLWLKPDNIAAARNLFAKSTNDANVYGWNLRHDATTGALFLQMRASGSLRQHTFDTALTAGVWQHIVFTYDGSSNISGARVYKDAVVGNTPASGAIGSTMLFGQNFTLASRNGNFEFSGLMTQGTVWGKALSASEVTTLYNSGAPARPDTVSFESDLVSWYPMGQDEGDTATTLIDNRGTNNLTLQNMSPNPYVSDVP